MSTVVVAFPPAVKADALARLPCVFLLEAITDVATSLYVYHDVYDTNIRNYSYAIQCSTGTTQILHLFPEGILHIRCQEFGMISGDSPLSIYVVIMPIHLLGQLAFYLFCCVGKLSSTARTTICSVLTEDTMTKAFNSSSGSSSFPSLLSSSLLDGGANPSVPMASTPSAAGRLRRAQLIEIIDMALQLVEETEVESGENFLLPSASSGSPSGPSRQ